MSWVRIYVHIVFSTKNRIPYLNSPEIRRKVFQHMYENARSKEIRMDVVNGYDNHAHCLVSLGRTQSVSDIAQLIKGESSFWINKQKIIGQKFTWQDDYWATGVDGDHVDNLRKYILRQEAHHSKNTFDVEIDKLFPSDKSDGN